MDADDNVLSAADFKQALGANVVTLPSGTSVARIDAGQSFTSEAATIPLPAGAPEALTLRLKIEQVHHHLGQPDALALAGPATSAAVSLVDAAYSGEITDISPQVSSGEEDIVINGRAVERDSGMALCGVPLAVIITLDGFERRFAVVTGDDGSFTIQRLHVDHHRIQLNIPKTGPAGG